MDVKIDVHINDDYAVLTTTNYGFYYGYEFDSKESEDGDTEEIWGFEVCDGEKIGAFRISYEKMSEFESCPDKWECDKCLLFGIALWLEKSRAMKKEIIK